MVSKPRRGDTNTWHLFGAGVAPEGAFLFYFVRLTRGFHPGLSWVALRAAGVAGAQRGTSLDYSGIGYSRKAWIRITPPANKLSGEDPGGAPTPE